MIASDVEFVDGIVKDAEEEITQLRKDKAALLKALKAVVDEADNYCGCDNEGACTTHVVLGNAGDEVGVPLHILVRAIEGRS